MTTPTLDLPALKVLIEEKRTPSDAGESGPAYHYCEACLQHWDEHTDRCMVGVSLALLAEVERLRLRLDELYSLAEESKP